MKVYWTITGDMFRRNELLIFVPCISLYNPSFSGSFYEFCPGRFKDFDSLLEELPRHQPRVAWLTYLGIGSMVGKRKVPSKKLIWRSIKDPGLLHNQFMYLASNENSFTFLLENLKASYLENFEEDFEILASGVHEIGDSEYYDKSLIDLSIFPGLTQLKQLMG